MVTEARIKTATENLLTHIDKYDNGIITRDSLVTMVRNEVAAAVNGTWDQAFTAGVQAEEEGDDDEPIQFVPYDGL